MVGTSSVILTIVGTGAAYALALRIAALLRHHPLANPILIASLLIILVLYSLHIPTTLYGEAAQPLRWLLAPATVALAVPIYRQRHLILQAGVPLLAALLVGSVVGIVSAVGLAKLLGLSPHTVQALAVKSVTSPFAIALMQRLGGPADLAAGFVIITGLIGAAFLPLFLSKTRKSDPIGYGLALGMAAHIVGNQHVARSAPEGLSVASMAFTLAGLITTLLLPALWPWISG